MTYHFDVFVGGSRATRERLNRKTWKNNPLIGKVHRIPSPAEKIKKQVIPQLGKRARSI